MKTWLPSALIVIACCSIARAQNPAKKPAGRDPESAAVGIFVDDLASVREIFRAGKVPAPPQGGLFVLRTTADAPAAVAGIHGLDVIVIKDKAGKVIIAPAAFSDWMKGRAVGEELSIDVYKLNETRFGSLVWVKSQVKVTTAPRAQVDDAAMRRGYLKIDGKWAKLPPIDVAREASQGFVIPKANKNAGGGAEDEAEQRERRTLLWKFEVGEWGTVSGCRVSQVLGDQEMMVTVSMDDRGIIRVATPDDPRDIRLLGFSTEGMTDGHRCKPGPFAIIGTWTYETAFRSSRTILMGVSLERIKKGLSDEELAELKTWLADHPDQK